MKSRSFIDMVTVYAAAGKGGNGCVSFRREKYIPRGGPNGGDGGRGGSIVFRADRDRTDLTPLYFNPHQRARSGGDGRGKDQHGSDGPDVVVRVPCGTEVWDVNEEQRLADLVTHGQEHVAAHGGHGGRGNTHWKSSTNQAPRQHTDGTAGEEITLRLKLKLIADIGLVGCPNAGKSSLLARLSDARPKVAPYPFTTLHPIVGTVVYDDFLRLTVADVPGLLEDAHKGVGLGHDFLRHIERARVLVVVVDMAGVDGRKPWEDHACLLHELGMHNRELLERPRLVVANKMDLPESAANLKTFRTRCKVRPLSFSALTGDGLPRLRDKLRLLAGAAAEA